MNDTDGKRDTSNLIETENVDCRSNIEDEKSDEKHEPTGKGLRSSELSRNICPFSKGGENHDEASDSTTQRNCTPLSSATWRGKFGLNIVFHQEGRRVECRI